MPKSKYELIYKDLNVRTKVITFTELIVDEKLSQKTDFPVGTEVYFIQRVRYLDDIAKMVDTNLLRKDIIKDLTKEIAQESLFEYYTKVLGIELTTIKRTVTVERTTPFDEHYLTLGDYNCMAVMTSKCYNQYGIQFEYSESRNRPDLRNMRERSENITALRKRENRSLPKRRKNGRNMLPP